MKKSNSYIFIILIPLFFIIVAFLYDNILMISSNKAYMETSKSIIEDVLINSYYDKETEVKKLYEDKKLETNQLNVIYDGEKITVYNVHTYPSFFGVVLGINSYRTEVDLTGYKDASGDIIIEENNSEE